MSIDLSKFAPIATTWLNMEPSYEGSGKATFKSPQGIIEGLVQARFDVLVRQQIEMDVLGKNIRSRRQLVFGLDEFLSGEKPNKRGKGFVMNMGLDYSNPCSRLTVATEHGKFRTDGKILCWPRGFAPPS